MFPSPACPRQFWPKEQIGPEPRMGAGGAQEERLPWIGVGKADDVGQMMLPAARAVCHQI